MGKIMFRNKTYETIGIASYAKDVSYDDTTSQLNVSTVQEAIEYLAENGSSGGAAEDITFDPTDKITATNVQDAIEAAAELGDNSMELTQAEYNALTEEKKMDGTIYYITDASGGGGSGGGSAEDIEYDNTESGLEAENVQDAIDETLSKIPTNYLKSSDVINNCNSTSATAPLSAQQGYLLNKFKTPFSTTNQSIWTENPGFQCLNVTSAVDAPKNYTSGGAIVVGTGANGTDVFIDEFGHVYSRHRISDKNYTECPWHRLISEEDLTPEYYTANNLTYSNCQYYGGGYNRVGNMIVANLVIRATSTYADCTVSKFPAPLKCQSDYDTIVACSVYNITNNSIDTSCKARLTNGGTLSFCSSSSACTYAVSFTYMCKTS